MKYIVYICSTIMFLAAFWLSTDTFDRIKNANSQVQELQRSNTILRDLDREFNRSCQSYTLT